ncbi:MAG: AMP-binding protein [Lentihominibacter sp.]|jgi:long-chain acyl-CoA synthetase
MYFFERNEAFANNIICIDDTGRSYTYGEIWDMGDAAVSQFPERTLKILSCTNDAESLAEYLALLRKSCPVILLGRDADASMVREISETYEGAEELHPDLALLLSTSGSTGDRKLVRLSYENLQSNCDSIVEYLELTAGERPVTTLPMEYTYGLSIIHSHVAVGATIIMTNYTLFNREFWDLLEKHHVTSLAGVPYTYEMLKRMRLTQMDLPHLKTLTQAGGHLKEEMQRELASWAAETGRRFFIMYGQTEATARMSYIPPSRCLEKIGSIGIPIPGGRIELAEDGEIIYYGPNVSMGYATCRQDLARGDDNRGRLETGDVAYADSEGYLYIKGRKKRFVKIYGKRFSLDKIQSELQKEYESNDIVCTGNDESGIRVWTTSTDAAGEPDVIAALFEKKWGIKEKMVTVSFVNEIPRNASGKVLYKELTEPDNKQ